MKKVTIIDFITEANKSKEKKFVPINTDDNKNAYLIKLIKKSSISSNAFSLFSITKVHAIISTLNNTSKINAIKDLKIYSDLSLRECKEIIDAFVVEYPLIKKEDSERTLTGDWGFTATTVSGEY